jgi:hypothetical protein
MDVREVVAMAKAAGLSPVRRRGKVSGQPRVRTRSMGGG